MNCKARKAGGIPYFKEESMIRIEGDKIYLKTYTRDK